MIDAFALALTVVCLGGAVAVGVQIAGGRFRWARWSARLALLEVALIAQALLDVVGLARGHRPAELPTHLAYLGVTVVLIPVVAGQSRAEDGRWSGAVVLTGLVVLAVVIVRLQTTWRSGPA